MRDGGSEQWWQILLGYLTESEAQNRIFWQPEGERVGVKLVREAIFADDDNFAMRNF